MGPSMIEKGDWPPLPKPLPAPLAPPPRPTRTALTLKLEVDTSRVRDLVNLFAEIINDNKEMAERLGCWDQEKVDDWAARLKKSLQIASR